MLESLIPSRLGLNQGIHFPDETRELVKILSGKAFFSRLSEKQKMEKLARSEVKGDMEEKWIEAWLRYQRALPSPDTDSA